MRLSQNQLDKIKEKYDVNTIWSWSRVEKFMNSPYEFFLKYILNEPEDRQDSIYVTTGSIAHDTLDKYYEYEISYKEMYDNFLDGWTTAIDICDLKFNRTDEEANDKLKEKYFENLSHFFKNHNPYKYRITIEKPVVINVNNNIFVGYIDALYKDEDGNVTIIDFKTSSKYTGKTLEQHSGQLTLYAIGIHQMFNIPFDKIKICFNFLKYVDIQYQQKNGTIKSRQVERCKIGECLQTNVKMWLKDAGYDDIQFENYLKEMTDLNTIECLPKEIQDKYVVDDCHVYIDLNEKLINKWMDTITVNINDINARTKDYDATNNEKYFWDSEESVKAQSYYFANLCSYSANKHKPYKEYLDNLENNKVDMFSGIGSSVGNGNKQNDKDIKVSNDVSYNDIDLSWLQDI